MISSNVWNDANRPNIHMENGKKTDSCSISLFFVHFLFLIAIEWKKTDCIWCFRSFLLFQQMAATPFSVFSIETLYFRLAVINVNRRHAQQVWLPNSCCHDNRIEEHITSVVRFDEKKKNETKNEIETLNCEQNIWLF